MISHLEIAIIESESDSMSMLEQILTEHFSGLQVSYKNDKVPEPEPMLEMSIPDVIFWDIDCIDSDSVFLQEYFRKMNVSIIFTARNEGFLKNVFPRPPFPYLVKPYDNEKIVGIMNFIIRTAKFNFNHNNQSAVKGDGHSPKIMLPLAQSYRIVSVEDIVRCEADTNYTYICMNDDTKLLMSKQLNKFEHMLYRHNFVRIHSKHLINLNYLSKYKKSKMSEVTLIEGTKLPVSKTYKQKFNDVLQNFYLKI